MSDIEFIGLGTDGSDGIEAGIHLRWAFPEKLGFPPDGIRLFRWGSHVGQLLSCFTPQEYQVGQTFRLSDEEIILSAPRPEKLATGMRRPPQDPPTIVWAKATRAGQDVSHLKITALERYIDPSAPRQPGPLPPALRRRIKALELPDYTHLQFRECEPDRIELEFYVTPNTHFQVVAHASDRDYEPVTIANSPLGPRRITIVVPGITALTFVGQGIYITQVCTYCCYRGPREDWQELTPGSGYRLPVGLDGTALEPYYHETNHDYMHALARLMAGPTERPMSLEEFEELYPVMEQLVHEDGASVPLGWSIPPEIEDSGDADESIPTLGISSYDTLRITALSKKIARVLGIYWLDQDVLPFHIYDYEIVASYPEDYLAKLEHQIDFADYDEADFIYSDLVIADVLFNRLKDPAIILAESSLARADRGLSYQNHFLYDTSILFNRPVREIHIFVKFDSPNLNVRARRHSDPAGYFPLEQTHAGPEVIVHFSDQVGLGEIRLEGDGLIIYRLHYDFEKLSGLTLKTLLCGLRPERARPLQPPQNLIATLLPAGATYAENKVESSKYAVGLRWDALLDPAIEKLPDGAVGYHVYRQQDGGPEEKITGESPVYITYGLIEPGSQADSVPSGWPEERQYYIDGLEAKAAYQYRVSAVDLFGRESDKSNPDAVTIVSQTPPPPANVWAKYLDYTTLNGDGTSSDPNLTSAEVAWLEANAVSGIVVGWAWTPAQAAICDEVDTFEIHFEPGWFNQFKGVVTSDPVEETLFASDLALPAAAKAQYPILDGVSEYETYRISVELETGITANGFRLSWLKQGYNSFLALQNRSGTTPDIWVLVPEDKVGGTPERDKSFVVTLQPRSDAFVNFRRPESWTDTSISASVAYNDYESETDGSKTYRIYIADPDFPNPAFAANETRPLRYAQIGVSAINIDGLQGSVSTPAPILAVHRLGPDPLSPGDLDYGSATATPPNVHGKSTFYFRWQKTGNGLKHFVYRALDETLFRVDLANDHRQADYEAVAAELGLTYATRIDRFTSVEAYKDLDKDHLFLVANMPGNEAAFTRLHAEPIDENDAAYQNRNTETPTIGAPLPVVDSSYLLYEDNTLDGRGSNNYFYRLRSVDAAGNLSDFSQATLPVEIPQVLPAVRPVITDIAGGENQVTIRWAQKSNPNILGYNVYRTADQNKAGDWRRMTLLKMAETDAYTVAAGANLSYTDATAVARRPYYYGVVAVTEDDDGHPIRSPMSQVRAAQAYDLTPPDPPEWDEDNSGWVYVDDNGDIFEWDNDLSMAVNPVPALRLVWADVDPELVYLVQRSKLNSGSWTTLLEWGEGDAYAAGGQYLVDSEVNPSSDYHIRLKAKSLAELISLEYSDLQIDTNEQEGEP